MSELKRYRQHLDDLTAAHEAKQKATFDMAHEIIMSHPDIEHSHTPGAENHRHSSYHGQPEHILAAMDSLKDAGWYHPKLALGNKRDEFELHHDDSNYNFNHYPHSILGDGKAMLTVRGGPRDLDW